MTSLIVGINVEKFGMHKRTFLTSTVVSSEMWYRLLVF